MNESFNVCNELRRFAPECSGQLEDDVDGRLVNAPLDKTDVIALHIGLQRQLLLRQSRLLPSFTENLAECQACVQTLPPLYEVALSGRAVLASSQHTVNFVGGMASFCLDNGTLLSQRQL